MLSPEPPPHVALGSSFIYLFVIRPLSLCVTSYFLTACFHYDKIGPWRWDKGAAIGLRAGHILPERAERGLK